MATLIITRHESSDSLTLDERADCVDVSTESIWAMYIYIYVEKQYTALCEIKYQTVHSSLN